MLLWTAFLLGLVGSFHCATMCGPLLLALPMSGTTRNSWMVGRLLYNLGRIATYGLLGAIFGLVGHTLALAGLQSWVSLSAGAAILIGLALSFRFAIQAPAFRGVSWLKSAFGRLLQRRTFPSLFLLGAINGLLPCGLVYAACAGAIASGHFFDAVAYMVAFGAGTLPMMLGLTMAGRKLQLAVGSKFQRLIPVSLALTAVLLLCRGLSLGIPYLSPNSSGGIIKCSACRQMQHRDPQAPVHRLEKP
jgi:uncharacterized protein